MAYTKFFLCISVVVMLIACGDNSSSADAIVIDTSFDVSESDMVVATKGDLPACTDKRDGAIAYVKDKKAAYICDNGSWVLDDDGKLSSSSSKTKSSSSSSKTKSSSSSGKAKSSSSSDKAKSSSSGKSSSSAKENSSSSSEFVIKDQTFYGFAQKGPFRAESVVNIYELDEKTLAKTERVFSGKVTSSGNGRFKVSHVNLSSPYALFEVKGRFRNEVTGTVSDRNITLYALVDLVDQKEVNVNVLTHLTYERILYLFGTGVDFAKAKKQAETEILNAFGFQGEFASFENLNIFGNDEGNAMLLAINVMALYNGEGNLNKFLDNFGTDFKEDGTWNKYWDGEIGKAKVADWVQMLDSRNEFSFIRGNVEKWKPDSVPNFEKYLRIFWYSIYGMDNCVEDEEDKVVSPKYRSTNSHFVCWNGAWNKMHGNDSICGLCSEKRQGTFCRNQEYTWDWYVCQNGRWKSTEQEVADTQGWTAGFDGEIRKGNLTDDFYKYNEFFDEWEKVYLEKDTSLKLNGCTNNRNGEMGLSPKDSSYYTCVCYSPEYQWEICEWLKSQEIDFIKRDNKCESEDVGRIVAGIDTITNKYYCSLVGWVNMETWSFGVPPEFRFNQDINYGSLTDDRDGKTYKTVKIGDQVWMAENLNYAGDGIGHCYDDVPEYCDVAGRLYKWDVARGVCPEGWHLPSKAEFDTLLSVVKLEYGEECSLADMFRATSGWSYGGQGCDKTGFSAVPAGGRHVEIYRQPEYTLAGSFAFFLTSTENGEHSVYVLALYSNDVSLIYDFEEYDFICYSTKDAGLSVRCLQDAE